MLLYTTPDRPQSKRKKKKRLLLGSQAKGAAIIIVLGLSHLSLKHIPRLFPAFYQTPFVTCTWPSSWLLPNFYSKIIQRKYHSIGVELSCTRGIYFSGTFLIILVDNILVGPVKNSYVKGATIVINISIFFLSWKWNSLQIIMAWYHWLTDLYYNHFQLNLLSLGLIDQERPSFYGPRIFDFV